MKKIAITGMIYQNNLGDEVIYETVNYLVEQIIQEQQWSDVELVRADIRSRLSRDTYFAISREACEKRDHLLSLISKKEEKNEYDCTYYDYWFQKKKCEVAEYYEKYIGDADCIIVTGGGLIKYKYEGWDYILENVIAYAGEKNIPVYCNAVGIEGYDEAHPRCLQLKRYLNAPCVKAITTRDDIDLLKGSFITNTDIDCKLVGDPALWTAETYGIQKQNSNVVGLGVIRENIFIDNEIDYKDAFLPLWVEIVKELGKRGYEWQIFTNGSKPDALFASQLLDALGCGNEKLDVAHSGRELARNISRYKGVISCRLHSSILSYALDVPAVGLVWNNKQTMFGRLIGHEERFLTNAHFDACEIVDCFEKALKEGNNSDIISVLKQQTYDALKQFLTGVI